jgi:hypothetical protein
MASVKVAPRLQPTESREHVERRVRFLAVEETRLAREGFYEGAQAAARERRYWEFLRALMEAPLGRLQTRREMH